jgi:hypothetical protein
VALVVEAAKAAVKRFFSPVDISLSYPQARKIRLDSAAGCAAGWAHDK